jgi:hypothetical protein
MKFHKVKLIQKMKISNVYVYDKTCQIMSCANLIWWELFLNISAWRLAVAFYETYFVEKNGKFPVNIRFFSNTEYDFWCENIIHKWEFSYDHFQDFFRMLLLIYFLKTAVKASMDVYSTLFDTKEITRTYFNVFCLMCLLTAWTLEGDS